MKRFIFVLVVVLISALNVSLAWANLYEQIKEKRIEARQKVATAHILALGIKENPATDRKEYLTDIQRLDDIIVEAANHVAKGKELLRKGVTNGEIGEETAKRLAKNFDEENEEIRTLIVRMDALSNLLPPPPNLEELNTVASSDALKEFRTFLEYIKIVREQEKQKWSSKVETKDLWNRAAGDLGFYDYHIRSLASSILYTEDQEKITQNSYDYVWQGVKTFYIYNQHLVEVFEKIEAAHNADLSKRVEHGTRLIRPYLTQRIFSGLPRQVKMPVIKDNPAEDMGFIPSKSMMQDFSSLPNKPTLAWLNSDKYAMQIFRAFYDRGIAHNFLRDFVNKGGNFSVQMTANNTGNEASYNLDDDILKIPQSKFPNGSLFENNSLLTTLLHELFHAYRDQIVDNNQDPKTSKFLFDVENWLGGQLIRNSMPEGGPKPWLAFNNVIDDKEDFAEEYVAAVINTVALQHILNWNSLHNLERSNRISLKKAKANWSNAENRFRNDTYSSYQNDDRISYEVQARPPKFVFDFVIEFYGLGVK